MSEPVYQFVDVTTAAGKLWYVTTAARLARERYSPVAAPIKPKKK